MRIGVVICTCGGRISEKLDVVTLAEKANELKDVAIVKQLDNLCKDTISIKKEFAGKVDRLLIVGCSERSSLSFTEDRIEALLVEMGINKAMFEVANVREQCAFLHDGKEATKKAIDMLRMAHAKLRSNFPILPFKIAKKALVIGAGPAGTQAALDLANAGNEVMLVEKKSYLGGHACQIPFLFQCEGWASMCTSECIVPVQARSVIFNPLVKVLTNSEVLDIEKEKGNFRVKIRKAEFVNAEKCVSCAKCAEVCPEEVENKFDYGFSKRKVIDKDFKLAIPDSFNLIEEACTKCGECVKVCSTNAINLDAKHEIIEDEFGAIILATGF